MRKSKAITALGGTQSLAAEAMQCSIQAISQWPDPLPKRIADRVLGVVALKHLPPEMLADLLADEQPAEAGADHA